MPPDPNADTDPVRQVVPKHNRSSGHRVHHSCRRKPGAVCRSATPRVPRTPEAEQDSAGHEQSNAQHEPAIRRVMKPARSVLPARQPESGHAEHAASRETASGVLQRARYPDTGQRRACEQDSSGQRNADYIDRREPASCTLTRGPHPISLHQRNRDQRDKGKHDQQRNQQQRHNTAYDIAQGAKVQGAQSAKLPGVPQCQGCRSARSAKGARVPRCGGVRLRPRQIVWATARPRRSRVAAKAGGKSRPW